MMTACERFLRTLLFEGPDRVPFSPGHPRESTLAAWHGQGLPEGAHWFIYLLEQIGVEPERTLPRVDHGVSFRMMPEFEERVLEHRGGHLVVQDWKGNVCEISDQFDVTYLRQPRDFVTRRWLRCPVENRDDWERMKARYDAAEAGRVPGDFAQRCRRLAERDWPLVLDVNGPFWQMREWCGFENLCLMMIEQPEFVDEMAAFWTAFVARVLERVLLGAGGEVEPLTTKATADGQPRQRPGGPSSAPTTTKGDGAGLVPDCLRISEDMAYKAHAMISPAMTRRFCVPSWRRWAGQVRAAGCRVVDVDSDGCVGEIIPLWIDSGVNCCDPMEVAAGNDICELRRLHGRRMAYQGGVDKRAMARGGRTMRAELRRIEPVVRDGGYIPGCDHGVPADVSWPDYVEYARALAAMTGWR